MERNTTADAEKSYEDAVKRAEVLKAAWEKAGCPAESQGSTRQPVPHPLLKAINEAELVAMRLREAVTKKQMGRPPSAVPKKREAPSQLRSVK